MIIFLDIDGVLNYADLKERSPLGYIGISDDKMILLKELVDKTSAKIVLISSWLRELRNNTADGEYLLEKFNHFNLTFEQMDGRDKWQGIQKWLSINPTEDWYIIDDEIDLWCPDFKNIKEHCILTSFSDGIVDVENIVKGRF